VVSSWLVEDPVKDALPREDRERVKMMKERARDFAEPLRSIVMGVPDDIDFTTAFTMGDWPTGEWDNRNGKVTLVGDAAHAMTMYNSPTALLIRVPD
jgi:2-polyprenyl-6-methoxyphenol hydroxylase-like FAD-dependent oxidoreductase